MRNFDAKSVKINWQETLMFIFMQKINFITPFFLKILKRNSKGGIQLLRSHLGGGRVHQNINIRKSGKKGANVSANVRL